MRFVWGIIWITIGVLLIRYTFQITNLFGKVDWAERHLSSGFGGTYAMYRIVGVIVIILAFLFMFGSAGFITDFLRPVFGG
jgi:hypothetical protein